MVFAPLTRRKHSPRRDAMSGARVSAPRLSLFHLLPSVANACPSADGVQFSVFNAQPKSGAVDRQA